MIRDNNRVKRGEMMGMGEMTRSLVFIVTDKESNSGQCRVNGEEDTH
jgi:hypothetical protein